MPRRQFELIAELDAATTERNGQGEPSEHVPKIRFEAGKVVFEVPHETLSKPNHADGYTEYMCTPRCRAHAYTCAQNASTSGIHYVYSPLRK